MDQPGNRHARRPRRSLADLAGEQGVTPMTLEEWAAKSPFTSQEEIDEFIAFNRAVRREEFA